MGKKRKNKSKTDHGKGDIKDNAMKALVRSKIFKPKVEKDKKKYNRKSKHKGRGDKLRPFFLDLLS